mmetsp:Transcript_25476/g.24798  ORF Transcript_25476/g.24798 Transcript_25476/m.24798 type:complete len:83 (+) Transcript_25476:121-369(+)
MDKKEAEYSSLLTSFFFHEGQKQETYQTKKDKGVCKREIYSLSKNLSRGKGSSDRPLRLRVTATIWPVLLLGSRGSFIIACQ